MHPKVRVLTILALSATLLASGLSNVAAHDPSDESGTDLNRLAFDQLWPLVGPGGPASDELQGVLEPLGFWAEEAGGDCTESRTHHYDAATAPCPDGDTHTPSFFQCDGIEPGIDLRAEPRNPFFHSSYENAIFEATGTFFVDIEFEGADADRVDQVWFIYFHTFPWPASSTLCSGPLPMPGAYVEFVTGDLNGEDGWEIPVNTLTVPDMAYGAGIRALDAQGNVLKTAFVYANVNNYHDDTQWQPGTPNTCDQDTDSGKLLCPYHDVTPPWPVVQGAEGQARTGNAAIHCPTGVAFEFGEPLSNWQVQGGSASTFPATPRDVETVPVFTVNTEAWGPAVCVTGFSLSDGITITAVDQSGNVAERTVTDLSI